MEGLLGDHFQPLIAENTSTKEYTSKKEAATPKMDTKNSAVSGGKKIEENEQEEDEEEDAEEDEDGQRGVHKRGVHETQSLAHELTTTAPRASHGDAHARPHELQVLQGLQGLQGGVVGLVEFALQRLLGARAPASLTRLQGGMECPEGVLGEGGEGIRGGAMHWLNGEPVALGRYVCRFIPIARFVTQK